MPDVLTHFIWPAALRRQFKPPFHVPLLLTGAVLPDYLREGLKLFLPMKFHGFTHTFHSFIGISLVALFLAALFRVEDRKRVFLSIWAGQAIHLFLDSLQGHLGGGRLYWFLPWFKSIEFNLISESYWHYLLIPTGILSLWLIYDIYRSGNKNNRRSYGTD
ncbi:MAG: hypothetical protein Kow0037_32190 [Calditrichia bacterium]